MVYNGIISTVTSTTVENVMSNGHPYVLLNKQINTGLTLPVGTVLARNNTITEAGDAGNQLSAWVIIGDDMSNTDNGVLYWGLTNPSGTNYTVSLYKDSGAAAADLVAEGTRSGNGSITLAEQNSSGISGTVTLAFSGADITYAANTLTLASVHAKYDVTNANHVVQGIVKEYSTTTGHVTLWEHGICNFDNISATNQAGREDTLIEALRAIGIYCR